MKVDTRVLDLKTRKIYTKTFEMELIKDVNNRGSIRYRHPLTNLLHREDGPAVEYLTGVTEWWLNGSLHRLDGPAIVDNRGNPVCWAILGKVYCDENAWRSACEALYSVESFEIV